MKQHSIWVERYRPKTISDIIFQDERQEQKFRSFVEDGDIPNLLLYGVQGTGKSAISRALIRDLSIESSDVLKINCSKDKIDAMRNDVSNFASTIPLGKFKVVRLEEFDFMSQDGQALLRSVIEDSSMSCRFIATCNYENRILPPLKSRFQQFAFKAPNKEKIAMRMADILEAEKIAYDPEHLLTYIDVGYPDIRSIIQMLQGNSQKGKLLDPKNASAETADWKFGLLSAISNGDFKAARKLVCESASREEHEDVFTFLYQNIDKMKIDQENAIVTIANYMKGHVQSSDTELNLAAMFIELSKL